MSPRPSSQASAFGPLRNPVFREIWVSSIASNIGTWMQNVGAAWLMAQLGSSAFEVSAVQAANYVPICLLALPAGALADVIDRRKILIWTQIWMLAAAAVLGVLTWMGATTSGVLLALTFLLSIGSALSAPAWQAVISDLVPRDEVPQAVGLNSASFNMARAIGPAAGGLVLALFGAAINFIVNAASFLGVIVVLFRWNPAKEITEPGKRENLTGAMVAGLRYVRHASELHAIMIRVLAFALPASALWALLPLVVHDALHASAKVYGILLGCLGLGAVIASTIQPALRGRFTLNGMAGLMAAVFGASTLALGWTTSLPLLALAMFVGGFAWLSLLANLNAAVQVAVPAWVRGRALSIYLLIFYAGLSGGSIFWGGVADHAGLFRSLLFAAIPLLLNPLLAFHFRLGGHAANSDQIEPSHHWPEPLLAIEPKPGDGPVLVAVEYRIDPARMDDFIVAMRELERLRRRDGATDWDLFRDCADPSLFLETFYSANWGEHMRQHERVTFADQRIEAVPHQFLVESKRPNTRHLVSVLPPEPFKHLTHF